MTIDVTGVACINLMGEAVYTFLVTKREEKKNIEISGHTRADNSPCGPGCASSMCLPK
jgi:proline racemase